MRVTGCSWCDECDLRGIAVTQFILLFVLHLHFVLLHITPPSRTLITTVNNIIIKEDSQILHDTRPDSGPSEMSHTLYTSCAEVLSLAQSRKDDLEALLDPETGFAPKLRQICQEQLAEAEEANDNRLSSEELEALRMESDTWGLLQAIMP